MIMMMCICSVARENVNATVLGDSTLLRGYRFRQEDELVNVCKLLDRVVTMQSDTLQSMRVGSIVFEYLKILLVPTRLIYNEYEISLFTFNSVFDRGPCPVIRSGAHGYDPRHEHSLVG